MMNAFELMSVHFGHTPHWEAGDHQSEMGNLCSEVTGDLLKVIWVVEQAMKLRDPNSQSRNLSRKKSFWILQFMLIHMLGLHSPEPEPDLGVESSWWQNDLFGNQGHNMSLQ